MQSKNPTHSVFVVVGDGERETLDRNWRRVAS